MAAATAAPDLSFTNGFLRQPGYPHEEEDNDEPYSPIEGTMASEEPAEGENLGSFLPIHSVLPNGNILLYPIVAPPGALLGSNPLPINPNFFSGLFAPATTPTPPPTSTPGRKDGAKNATSTPAPAQTLPGGARPPLPAMMPSMIPWLGPLFFPPGAQAPQFLFAPPQPSPPGLSTPGPSIQPTIEDPEEKKKKQMRPFIRKPRQVRPKVVEAKGALQCEGTNRKKNSRCRNAALMEYFGPRPRYCAEHIDQDPGSLYTKCRWSDPKGTDGKTCKEVVLKEFVVCHKHYGEYVNGHFHGVEGHEKANEHLRKITSILETLEKEALHAKKSQQDLYQRKNKLIPKFCKMRDIITQRIVELELKMKCLPDHQLDMSDDLVLAPSDSATSGLDAMSSDRPESDFDLSNFLKKRVVEPSLQPFDLV